jgi:hypothetical protein
MAAGLFGALGAIGDTGNQWAESRQMAHDEIVRRLAEQDAQKLRGQNLQKGSLALKAMQAPIALGTPYVSNGKKVQDYQDPITGAITNSAAPGGLPETTQEAMFRGLTGIGDTPEDAREAVTGKAAGKKPKQYMGVEPDPSSPTGYSMVHRDETGKFLWKITAMAPRQGQQRKTDSTAVDAFGIQTHRSTLSGPVMPNAARLTLPENATYAPGSAPGGYTIGEDGSLTPNQPQGGQGGQGGYAGPPAAFGGQPGAAAPRAAAIVSQLASGGPRSATMAVPNPKGMVEPGNIPIWNRPTVQNADGTHSSEFSRSFGDDQGHEVLVPTVVNGRFLTPDGRKPPEGSDAEEAMFKAAWDHYEKTGQNLGKFDSVADADAYADVLHNRGNAPAAAATPAAAIMRKLAAAKVPAPTQRLNASGSVAPSGEAPLPKGQGYNIGPYQGLDETGHIPARPGLNPQLVAAANRLLDNSDVTKLGVRGADLQAVTSLAGRYGWRQGSLTPPQQMQIHQVDNSLKAISDPKMLSLFDSTTGRMLMSTVPLDPTGEGGFGGFTAALKRSAMSQQQTEYMNALTRLRGVIGGIRGFTGANNSNATADRLLAELPNFTNTKNSADAKDKIDKLRQEVEIIKRLGYFLPDGDPRLPTGAAPAAQDNPLNLKLPTAGR